jgi:hypothetical protein
MKRKIYILVAVSLLFSTVWIRHGLCQFTPMVGLANFKHNPIVGNQLQFTIVLSSVDTRALWGVKKITAVNTLDSTDAYTFPLTPSTQALTWDLVATGKFNNQQGQYQVTIEKQGVLPTVLTTSPMPQVVPYPTPRNLRVSFESGIETPTLSFDPIPDFTPDGTTTFYQIRVYDKHYTRLIYRMPGLVNPEVVFLSGTGCPGPGCRSTAEDLIPGESYIFRADVTERHGPLNFNAASSFISFKIPKK